MAPADAQPVSPPEQAFDVEVEYGGSPAPPAPTAPANGPSWSDFQDTPASGSAAAETQRLIDELQAGRPVVPPTFPTNPVPAQPEPPQSSWAAAESPSTPPAVPAQPFDTGGVFPPGDVPDYAPLAPDEPPTPPSSEEPPIPPLPPAAPFPAVPAPPAFDPPERSSVLDGFDDVREEPSARSERSSSRLLPMLLIGALLVGAAYLGVTQLFGGASDDLVAPTPRSSPRVTATRPAPEATYSAEQIAASLKNPHFKHGYDAGVRRAKAGAVNDSTSTCRAMALREREKGYPWGAQDQQGCIVGIAS